MKREKEKTKNRPILVGRTRAIKRKQPVETAKKKKKSNSERDRNGKRRRVRGVMIDFIAFFDEFYYMLPISS